MEKLVDVKKLRVVLYICFIVLVYIPAAAQQPADSSNSSVFSDFNFISDVFHNPDPPKDSILFNSFFYDKLKQQNVFVPVTGNPGSASLLFFDETATDKIMSDGFNQFLPYLVRPLKTFPLPEPERRFSNISYHIGSKKEQHIFIKHEQKIKPWFVAGFEIGALSAPGDFSRTLNKNRGFDVYLGYEAPSKVYRVYASFTSNLIENEENGGISSDSVFENASSLNTRTLPINLPNALNKHRSRDYFLKQELNLTRLIHKADSVERAGEFKSGSLVFSHSLWWNRKYALFTSQDAADGYFENYYIDSTITYDSSFYNDLYQVAMLEYTTAPSVYGRSAQLGAGYEYQQNNYETGIADTSFSSGAVVLSAGYTSKRFNASAFYSKSVEGDFNNGYRSRLNLNYALGKQHDQLYLKIAAGKTAHTAKEIRYVSNHFLWNTDFELLEQYDLTAGFTLSKYRLNLEARSRVAKHLVFYREDCLPQSFDDYVAVSDIAVSNTLKYRKFGLDTKFVLSTTGNENVAPVPLLSLFSSVFYQNRFFKNVLGFKSGIDVSYFSEYYGYGYMPATGVFYLQNEKKIGNYPQFGVFVNLKIKSKATLFIRLDHFNAGISDRTYYGAYHYPLPGRTIKFGVNWNLID